MGVVQAATITESEPNNRTSDANPINIGDDYTGTIFGGFFRPCGDRDTASFFASKGTSISARLILPEFEFEIAHLRLLDTDGTHLDLRSSFEMEALITIEIPEDGTYFLQVHADPCGLLKYTLELRGAEEECSTVDVTFPRLEKGGLLAEIKGELLYSISIPPKIVTFTPVEPVDSSLCTFNAVGTRQISLSLFPDSLGIPFSVGEATFDAQLDLKPDTEPPSDKCDYIPVIGKDGSPGKECFHNTPSSDKNNVARWQAKVLIEDTLPLVDYSQEYERIFWVNLDELGIASSTPVEEAVRKVELFIEERNFQFLPGIFFPVAIFAEPPSDLLVTDPNGLRTGLSGDELLSKIPGSTYVIHEETTLVVIIDPADGVYEVQVIGVPSEPFSLVMSRADFSTGFDDHIVSQVLVESTLGPSGVNTYTLGMALLLNVVPTADAGPDQTGALISGGAVVTLDGSGSSDPDGDPLAFTWTGPFSEGGGTVTGVSPTVTLATSGVRTITLTVDDGKGGSDTDTVDITVVEPINAHFPGLSPSDTTQFFDSDGVCDGVEGLAGTLTIGATFVHNAADTDTLSGLFFDVAVLTGEGNVLCNADGGPGGVGSTLTVPIPLASDYSDGLLGPGESFDVEFVIGLVVHEPFDFFVNTLGIPMPPP